jgi:hypothetical protein
MIAAAKGTSTMAMAGLDVMAIVAEGLIGSAGCSAW